MSWIAIAADYLAKGWVGSLIGIVSLIAAFGMYLKGRQRTNMSFAYRGGRLLGLSTDGLPAEITMQFRGESIPRLTKSVLVFWNSGEKTIVEDDIVKTDPLRIAIGDDGEILSISILHPSREVNEVSIARCPRNLNEAFVTFSFLDACDGAVIEVLHTSNKSSPQFLGTLRGIPKGMRNLGNIARSPIKKRLRPYLPPVRWVLWIPTIIGGISMLVGLLAPIDDIEFLKTVSSMSPSSGVVLGGAFYFFIGVTTIFVSRRKYPRTLHVDEFE